MHYQISTYSLPVESLKIVHKAEEPYINYYIMDNIIHSLHNDTCASFSVKIVPDLYEKLGINNVKNVKGE